jgi:hypothetical protein
MRRWLIAGACSAMWSAGVNAAPMPGLTAPLHKPSRTSHIPDLRLVQQVDFGPARIRQSGMIADTTILPNARLGLGLFNVSRSRSGPFDARIDGRPVKSRKLGVHFRLDF